MAVITKKEVRVDNISEKVIEKGIGIGKTIKNASGFVYRFIKNTFVLIFYQNSDPKTIDPNYGNHIREAEIRQQALQNIRYIR